MELNNVEVTLLYRTRSYITLGLFSYYLTQGYNYQVHILI